MYTLLICDATNIPCDAVDRLRREAPEEVAFDLSRENACRRRGRR